MSMQNPHPAVDPAQLSKPKLRSDSSSGLAGLAHSAAAAHWAEDGCRQQQMAGGYEWWHFEAIDPAGNGVAVTFFDGFPFHPTYVRQLYRYDHRLGKAPDDTPWPDVLPRHYPAASLSLYEGGVCVSQFVNVYPESTFDGVADSPELRVGPNRITLRQDGSFGISARGYPWTPGVRGGKANRQQVLSAELTFDPTFPGVQHSRKFRPDGPGGAKHYWILAAPHGRITGHAQLLTDHQHAALIDMPVQSLGYHDHRYGEGSLGEGLSQWLHGHILGDNWAVAWHHVEPRTPGGVNADGLILFEKDQRPLAIEAPSIQFDRSGFTGTLARYPRRVTITGQDPAGNAMELTLAQTAILENTPFQLRVASGGTLRMAGRRDALVGQGTADIGRWRRLRLPLLSDAGLGAIAVVDQDDPLWRE